MTDKVLKLRQISMFICAAVVFIYLAVLCLVNPSKELLFAIAIELLSFAGFLFFRLRRRSGDSGRAEEAVFKELGKQYSIIYWWQRFFRFGSTTFWLASALGLCIDCFAFCTAYAGMQPLSMTVYRAVPITFFLGFHPAASLEVLAGAYVEAGKYSRAMPLYQEIMAIRLATFGPAHKEIAALYCDFGDLYSRQSLLSQAEPFYRNALAISTALLGDQGSGRAYTRLADCLRDQGRYKEASVQYQNAYQMRLHQFGPNSIKVSETLADWSKMLRLQGRAQEALAMQKRVERMQNLHRQPSSLMEALYSVGFFVLSLLISNILIGRRGILTELVVGKIKASIDASAVPQVEAQTSLPPQVVKAVSRAQLSRLITLYRFQKKYDEANHYSAILTALGKE